ncbi:2,3-diaminopropionate biosynthesis protein SbnA, partial [Streptomyces sp. NPDC001312]
IRTCHQLARHGFLFGGSTGTIVSGAITWLTRHNKQNLTATAIAPDLGERYLETIYQPTRTHNQCNHDTPSPRSPTTTPQAA